MKPKQTSPAKRAAARRYLRQNWSLMALHALYQRWGLPTSLLLEPKPKRRKAK